MSLVTIYIYTNLYQVNTGIVETENVSYFCDENLPLQHHIL
jgi:hypothetical protein